MKLYYYIGIHLIAPNDINMQELSMKLEEQIQKYLPHAYITLETNEPYWKDLASNSIVYSILNNQNIKIADIITLFPISWNYSESYAYNTEIQRRVDSEDALWSQLCHPEEVFLLNKVRWVNIYTWETNKEPIIH